MSGNPFADLIPTSCPAAVEGLDLGKEEDLGPETPQEPPTYSEWSCPVVRIVGFCPVPDADRIKVARFVQEPADDAFEMDYPVVVRSDGFAVGDLAVYVPVDSVLPDDVELAFLGSDRKRLRAKKLRGVYSEGLLISWSDFSSMVARRVPGNLLGTWDAAECSERVGESLKIALHEGSDCAGLLGITKYIPSVRPKGAAGSGSGTPGSKKAPDESVCPAYRVSNAKKGEGLNRLNGETRVIVTEKLHGANIRFGTDLDGKFFLGSHNTMRKAPAEGEAMDWFQEVAYGYNLWEKLNHADITGFAFYGEVLGVQDLTYGHDKTAVKGLRIFDVYALSAERWLAWNDVVEMCRAVGLNHAPVLYDGPLNECNYRELAEGATTMPGANHVREGVVIRTYAGGPKEVGPSRKWKYVGQSYRMRKGNQTDDQE